MHAVRPAVATSLKQHVKPLRKSNVNRPLAVCHQLMLSTELTAPRSVSLRIHAPFVAELLQCQDALHLPIVLSWLSQEGWPRSTTAPLSPRRQPLYSMSADVFDSALDLEQTHLTEGHQQGVM